MRTASATAACLLLSGWTALLPVSATAQDLGTDCEFRSYRSVSSDAFQPGQRVTWIGSPDLICPDGTQIRADSAVVYQAAARYELMGRVQVIDPDRELRAAYVDYFEGEGRLFARGSVEFRDIENGTEIRGDTLNRLESGALRTEDQLTVSGSPATALLPSGDGPDADPYRVRARQLRFEGDRFFWADEAVEVERGLLYTSSNALVFDRQQGNLFLSGQARMVDADAEFQGERINLALPDDQLRSIILQDRGRLVTTDLELLAEEIRITVENEEIETLVAVHRGDPEDPEGPPPPHLVTEDFLMVGDSIELDGTQDGARTVQATGRAWGRAQAPGDPLPEVFGPPSEREVGSPDALGEDWIEGNEIIAAFEVVPVEDRIAAVEPPPDPGSATSATERRTEYRLLFLEANGDAATFYRSPPGARDGIAPASAPDRAAWDVTYVLADAIVIYMRGDGEVERIEARGNVRGTQLEAVRTGAPVEDGSPAGAPQEDRE